MFLSSMAITANHFMPAMLMLGLLITTLSLGFTVAQIGVDYGRNGDGLPPPPRVVELYKQFNIRRMRIYDTDPDTLNALRGSNIELTVGIQNRDLQSFADNPANANNWVRDNIMKYPNVKFRHVVVGNEVRPGKPDTQQYAPYVLKAMQNIHKAISPVRPDIKVTTAVDTEVIDPSSNFPPENGRFRPEVAPYLNPIVRFLVETDAPLFANIYPYFAYLAAPDKIPLPYALLDPKYPGVGKYQNLFYAMVDLLNAALKKSVRSMSFETADMKSPPVMNSPPNVVSSETGWSTDRSRPGLASTDADGQLNAVANIENAKAYVNNLIQAVKKGTPMKPGQPIETYIFAMFDENRKPGNAEERNFGLFTPAGVPKYQVNFN